MNLRATNLELTSLFAGSYNTLNRS